MHSLLFSFFPGKLCNVFNLHSSLKLQIPNKETNYMDANIIIHFLNIFF